MVLSRKAVFVRCCLNMERGTIMLRRIQEWDTRMLHRIAARHTKRLDRIMVLVTRTGNNGYIWFLISIPMLFLNRYRAVGYTGILAMLISAIAGEVTIKHIVARVRPCSEEYGQELLIKHPAHYSFPSGHTSASFSMTAVMFFMLPILFIPVLIYACMMGLSRIYLLVHYPSDVIAGVVLGSICGTVAVSVYPYIPFFPLL